MFDRYRDNVDALIGEIGRDEPQKPRHWVHDGLRRELPAESQEAFEARVKRSAFSNLLQNEERLCLDAMIAKLNELGYDVGCKTSRVVPIQKKGPAQNEQKPPPGVVFQDLFLLYGIQYHFFEFL